MFGKIGDFMKNKIILFHIVFFLIVSLCACGENTGKESTGNDISRWSEFDIEIIGSKDTDENPWGYTAGVIEDDEVGNCILLTPESGVVINNVSNLTMISLQAKIHPWVAQNSDGAGVDITFLNSVGDTIEKDAVSINNGDNWVDIQYDLTRFPDLSKISFKCNGGTGDYSSDWVVIKKAESYLSSFGKDGYVRTASYFGDVWPINFWNSEYDHLEEDFNQILNDGFNSIILVIPWKEFQTSIDPISYNDYAFENLNYVMTAAESCDLDVYVRVSYAWDFYNDSNDNIKERVFDLLRSEKTRAAWSDYCKRLYEELSQYTHFKDGFLTWEDFWWFLEPSNYEDENTRLEFAKSFGYQEWVGSAYDLQQYNNSFNCDYKSYEDIPVPRRSEPAMEAYFIFYDYCLNSLLADAQSVFSNMSLEVRLDADGVTRADGTVIGCSHKETYACQESDYTATMYGIPMGFDNQGQKVTALEAIEHTDYILKTLAENNGGKPIYIDQFLFKDNTPQFSHNVQIKDEEVGSYLEIVSEVLKKYTKGYAIWTYRDYRNNMIYNSQFALGDKGWQLKGNPKISNDDVLGSWSCILEEGDGLFQEIPSVRNHQSSNEYTFLFDVVDTNGSKIEVSMGSETSLIDITKPGQYEVSFPVNDSYNIKLNVLGGNLEIDNLCLYSFVQVGGLYDEWNKEMEYISSVRTLNKKLVDE